ncbi:MAG TPA: universal stress protein, partial [Mycobacterium sp.]|nr:universal stress protein [Mycobacterium sp.]
MCSAQNGLVVGVDGSAPCDAAIRWAARDAVLRGLPLTMLHVVTPTPADSTMGPAPGVNQSQQDRARHILDMACAVVEEVVGGQLADLHIRVRYAGVVPALLEASTAARMVVVGRRGAGALRLSVPGSVSEAMLHHAACPVAVVPDPPNQESRVGAPVLVGVDGSPASRAAMALAFEEASSRGVAVVALHAWSDVGVFPVVGMDWRTNR